MKNFIRLTFLSFILLMVSCDSDINKLDIVIKTGEIYYMEFSEVDVTITNNSSRDLYYFKCDNVDLSPSQILRYDNGKWIAVDYNVVCTDMGPSGYFGVLKGLGLKQDTVPLDRYLGKIKLRYKFMIDKDTLTIDSNEFNVNGYI